MIITKWQSVSAFVNTVRYIKSRSYNPRDLNFENDYSLKDNYTPIIPTINLLIAPLHISDFANVTFPDGASAIIQQSRFGEQRRLFTITNVTRLNSAIRSYCSCRRRGTIHRLRRAAGARSVDCTRSISLRKTDSISIHLFSLPFH